MTSDSRIDRILRRWLVATAISVVATIAIGGATRLTESGLSITEWRPVTGVIPPMNAAAWQEAFDQYRLIPEAQTVHAGITLAQFKDLYWWEWAHRLSGRVVGLVVVIPFLLFWRRGWIRPSLFVRLLSLPLLVGAQGVLGWYMVRSGLSERTSVSPYRLVAHLSLALLIFGIAVRTAAALGRRRGEGSLRAPRAVRTTVVLLTAAVVVTMMSGGFVAGLDAGRIFNEFPLMGGKLVPDGYGAVAGFRNWFENPIAAQFNHRVLALLVALATWGAWWMAERRWQAHLRGWMRLAAIVALIQVSLGITTLLLAAPVGIAMAHQLGAVALLAVMLRAGVEATDTRIQ
ncbi:MAG TPA: COX15/CtaA family protein [Gemmatimonadaceae bacterium]|nr:COX15/CtaA family protein [Gemmatimonadaceae bacterium]